MLEASAQVIYHATDVPFCLITKHGSFGMGNRDTPCKPFGRIFNRRNCFLKLSQRLWAPVAHIKMPALLECRDNYQFTRSANSGFGACFHFLEGVLGLPDHLYRLDS